MRVKQPVAQISCLPAWLRRNVVRMLQYASVWHLLFTKPLRVSVVYPTDTEPPKRLCLGTFFSLKTALGGKGVVIPRQSRGDYDEGIGRLRLAESRTTRIR
jgi:hypothetical protein